VNDKECNRMMIEEVRRVTGYRFTVHDHPMIATGYKTRLHCSQDIDTKKASKPRQGNNIIHRETVGMERFPCHGRLNVTSRSATALNPSLKIVIIRIEHHAAHVLYYDVSMKSEALHILHDNLQWSTPSSLVPIIQESHPEVTAAQIHSAWTRMSEEIWKKDQAQLPSAKILLDSAFGDEVDVLEAITEDGVDMLAWGMKKVIQKLDIVQNGIEIALDATCESKNCTNLNSQLITYSRRNKFKASRTLCIDVRVR
ncbi:hypothetical protein F5890DRAFT_1417699, partial [Lentinula detonsa]